MHKVYKIIFQRIFIFYWKIKISDLGFVEELVDDLKEIFSMDKDFSEKKFEKQMAVVRGQALNLASAMR